MSGKGPDKRPQNADVLIAMLEDPSVVSGAVPSSQVANARTAMSARRNRMAIMAGALALSALGTMYAMEKSRSGAVTPAPAAPAVRSPTVGVLPLVSISADSTDNYIAAGMTDEITSALARVRGLRVASRSAAAAAQEGGPGVEETAKRLGVSFLLEGTVQREGKRLRVTARLVNGADGFTVWSDVFDRTTSDLLTVQSVIANAIAAAVRVDMAGAGELDTSTVAATVGTRDLEAYNEYLRGHFLLERRGEQALKQAVAAFNIALKHDSLFARAWAELAQAYAVLPLHSAASPDSLWPLAERAAERALALDSTLAAAHAALGNIYNGRLRWREGRLALERAIRLDSSYASAYQWLGENLLLNGDNAGARSMFEQAARRDPSTTIVPALLALTLGVSGNRDSAVAIARDAVTRDPSVLATRVMLGSVYLYAQRPREAVRELEVAKAEAPSLPLVLGSLGYAYAVAGDKSRASAIADTLQRMAARAGAASALAKVQLGLGDRGAALNSLERAIAARDPFFSSEPLSSPLFDSIRGDPRFARIVGAAGLDLERLTKPAR
jgi:eukaryotic-like serine/threonine-protein kinase